MQTQHLDSTSNNPQASSTPFFAKKRSGSSPLAAVLATKATNSALPLNPQPEKLRSVSKEKFQRFIERPNPQNLQKRHEMGHKSRGVPSYASPMQHRTQINLNWNAGVGENTPKLVVKESEEPISSIYKLGMPKSRTNLTPIVLKPIEGIHNPASLTRLGAALNLDSYLNMNSRLEMGQGPSISNLQTGTPGGITRPYINWSRNQVNNVPSFFNLNKLNNNNNGGTPKGLYKSQIFLNSLILDDVEEQPSRNQSFMDLRQAKMGQNIPMPGVPNYYQRSGGQIELDKTIFDLNWGGLAGEGPSYPMSFGGKMLREPSLKKLPSIHNLENLSQTGFRPPKKVKREVMPNAMHNFNTIDYKGLYAPTSVMGAQLKSTTHTFDKNLVGKTSLTMPRDNVNKFKITRPSMGNLGNMTLLQKRRHFGNVEPADFKRSKLTHLEPISFPLKLPSIDLNRGIEVNCTGFEMTQSPMQPGVLGMKRNGVSVSVGVEMGVDKAGEERETQLQRGFGGQTWQRGLGKKPRKSKSSTSLDGK